MTPHKGEDYKLIEQKKIYKETIKWNTKTKKLPALKLAF
jgi:hypothetical protein